MTDLQFAENFIERNKEKFTALEKEIWNYGELPYQEEKSAALLQKVLEENGFSVTIGVGDVPTSFAAKWAFGTGKPVAGFLGEYDALDTLSQEAATPVKKTVCQGKAGHGCGHNLLGVGSLGAALAYKSYLEKNKKDGTVIYFGCAAEKGAGSKQFMARAGAFDNVDFIYTWHPSALNRVQSKGSVAIMGANFIFKGISSHAGATPHLGRSGLDAAELVNVGVNYLREHIPTAARVHYAYSDAGGTAPNVVQERAVIKYEVRSPKVSQVKELFARVVNIAKGAALMTETEMEYQITMAFSDYTPNKTLAQVAQKAFEDVGAPNWEEKDFALAKEFLNTYNKDTLKDIKENLEEYFRQEEIDAVLEQPLDRQIHPFNPLEKAYESGSTDVGDAAYAAPTVQINVATACIGNVGHTWQMTAQANSPIGEKGMLCAAKVMALSAIRTLENPQIMEKAKEEFIKKTGGIYTCPLPDNVKPPVGIY